MEKQYTIKIKNFEGPLDILLALIEKRKLHINDVALSEVADDFLKHIKESAQLPLGESAHFILVASTLVLIKSRSLLPTLQLSEEEEKSITDLEERLALYGKMKILAEHIRRLFGTRVIFFATRENFLASKPIFSPHKKVSAPSLREAMRAMIANLPSKDFIPQILVKKVINLEDMILELAERVQTKLNMSFSEFTQMGGKKEKEHKIRIIVGFLAMLELVKRGIIKVTQDKHFHDIDIESQKIGVPKYG